MTDITVPQILRRAAEKAGLKRVRYVDNNCPTNAQNCCVMLLYGDLRSSVAAASLLVRRYQKQVRSSKYFIICTWPGFEDLFPGADEVWTLNDLGSFRGLYNQACGITNKSDIIAHQQRILHTYFEDVQEGEVFIDYYDHGLKKKFFETFQEPKVYLPEIPSSMILGHETNRRLNQYVDRVFLFPSMYIQTKRNGRLEPHMISKDFWKILITQLLGAGIYPVVYQSDLTYDLSPDFAEQCLFSNNPSIGHVLSLMRSTGCVLDVYSGISRLALLARTPSVILEDRQVYHSLKDYELDDLISAETPKKYFYYSPIICEQVNKLHWSYLLFNDIIAKIKGILTIDKDGLPAPVESEEVVSYNRVKNFKSKKLGIRFIKVKEKHGRS